MATNNITSNNINKETKKKKRVKIRLIKKKEYWLPEELFRIVKEYAGVYNITTKWNKIMSVGVVKIHNFYRKNFGYRITNVKSNSKNAKRMILKSIIERGMNEEKYKLLAKLVVGEYDFSKYKVGEEITHKSNNLMNYTGIITKVNKASITFKPYKTIWTDDDYKPKYYYDKNNFQKPKTIRKSFQTKNADTMTSKELNAFDFNYFESIW